MHLVIDCCPNCGNPGDQIQLDLMNCPLCHTHWRPVFPLLVSDLRACGCHRDPAIFGHYHVTTE